MIIKFIDPLYLMILPVVLGIIYLMRAKNKLFGIIRSLILILIVMAIAGVTISQETKDTNTLFLIDKSNSMLGSENSVEEFVNGSLENKKAYDRVGVISFGKDAQIEYSPRIALDHVSLEADVETRYTNIEDSISLALAMCSDEMKNRIVLISDGEENIGDFSSAINNIKRKNIEFKVYDLNAKDNAEVQINKIKMPSRVYKNQQFDIEAEVWSNTKTTGIMKVYSNNRQIGEKEISINQGINRFAFSDKLENTGFENYSVEIEVEGDTNSLNNKYVAFTEVLGSPRVLLIDNEREEGKELKKIIESMDIEVDYQRDREVYVELADLMRYKAVIMTNISLENLDSEFSKKLEVYVKDFGGGLVVTGGNESYALGGYYKSDLEKILPLNMEIKRDGIVPSVSIMLVIDKSGSMSSDGFGIDKLAVAREAALRAVETMKPTDKIGLITFDNQIYLNTSPLGYENKGELEDKISSITAGGGTTILPALAMANDELNQIKSDVKHVILLTDGQAEQNGYDAVLREMNNNGITVSTIAVGAEADDRLLTMIAEEGKGRFYHVEDYDTMPSIFTKETLMVSKVYLNNRDFYPQLIQYDSMVEPLLNGTPLLKGYIATSVKPEATLILESDRKDPILAQWRYGLGKVVCFTSDVNGGWSRDYLTSTNGVDFFKNMARTAIPLDKNDDYDVAYEQVGDEIEITVHQRDRDENIKNLQLKIYDEEGSVTEGKLALAKPGEYQGSVKDLVDGVHLIRIQELKDDGTIYEETSALSVNYSKEYNFANRQSINQELVKKVNGQIITNEAEVFTEIDVDVKSPKEISDYIIMLALILFVVDIAVRKFNITVELSFLKRKKVQDENGGDTATVAMETGDGSTVDMEADIQKEMRKASKKNKGKKEKQESPTKINTNRLLDAKKRRG